MSRAHTSRFILRSAAPVLMLGLAFSATADPQIPSVATVLCPLPYLDMMGERQFCDHGTPERPVTNQDDLRQQYVSKVRTCEGTLADWDNAWQICAERVYEMDRSVEGGYRWEVYPASPPSHGCRYTAEAASSWDLISHMSSHCQEVMDWWKSRYRTAIRNGYLYELSPHDGQRLQGLIDNYTRPLDR